MTRQGAENPRGASSDGLERALRAAARELGFELPESRRASLLRRLSQLARRSPTLSSKIEEIRAHDRVPPEVLGVLTPEITIGETRLFRHAELILVLRAIARRRRNMGTTRILSVGCSTGEEVWSIAAVLADGCLPFGDDFSVVGWEVDATRLRVARDGTKCRPPLGPTEPALERFFESGPSTWSVREPLRRHVSFECTNLAVLDRIDQRFHLIVVCNTAIYWRAETADAVLRALLGALAPDGWLFVGPVDVLPPALERADRLCRAVSCLERDGRPASLARHKRTPARKPRPPRALPPMPERAGPARDALELANVGEYERALTLLDTASSLDVEARFLRALVLLGMADVAAARDELRACAFLEPEEARFRRWIELCAPPRASTKQAPF